MQPDLIDVALAGSSARPIVEVGRLVKTSYGTGPYRITEVNGPCECPEFLRHLDGDDTPSEPHYHIVCETADGEQCWLNGHRLDGTSVWGDDGLIPAEETGKAMQ